MKIKTIDLHVKEWFDTLGGNTYFSGQIHINYGMKNHDVKYIPFQYGYGTHSKYVALETLTSEKMKSIGIYCRENNIIFRNRKDENCRKRDVVAHGTEGSYWI